MKMIMRAIRIHQYGGPEVLAQVEMQRPTPGANEVLIKVKAASVNPLDWKLRAGHMKDFLPLTLPVTLGSDVSGTVEEVGPGAAGGVGNFAVQFAKAKGAYVIGTASSKNQAFLGELGVDKAVDYKKTRFEDVVQDADVVLDTIGGDTQERSFKALKKGGILVSIVQPPSQELAAKLGVRALFYGAHPSSSDLTEIARLIDSGKVKTVVETILPLAEARRAHELSQSGHARGKIVLKAA